MNPNWKHTWFFVFFLSCSFAIQGKILADDHDSPQYTVDTELYALEAEGKNLCGINALYFGLRFFGKEKPYPELIKKFPGVREKGLTMRQLESFLKQEGIHCKIMCTTRKNLFSFNKSVGFFIFEKNEEQTKEVLSHLYFANPLSENEIQIFDFPNFIGKAKKSETSNQVIVCLFAAKTQEELPATWNKLPLWGGLFLLSLLVFLHLLRKKPEKSTQLQ